jgi:serine phosphatase RsbU (regulator of sigma subunit)/tetratricopeptide (TPR) repeat protein
MVRYLILWSLSLLLISNVTKSQNSDSLRQIVNSSSQDSIKSKALFELATLYSDSYPDSSILYLDNCIQIAGNNARELIKYKALNSLSLIYIERSNFAKAKDCIVAGLDIAQRMNDSMSIAKSHSNLGSLYSQIELKEKAIFHLKEASRYINTSKNPTEAGKLYGRLGNFYLNNGYYDEAEYNYQKAISFFKSGNSLKGIIIATQNLGVIEKRRKKFDSAINYYNQALISYETIGYSIGVGQCLANIGNIYAETGQFEKAIRNHEDALRLFKKNHQITDEMLSYAEIADVYNKQHKYEKALRTINKARVYLDSMPENDGSKIAILYQLHLTNKNVGNINLAYKYLLEYQSLNDTLNVRSSEHELETLKIQYEVEQKDRDLTLLTIENKLKDTELKRKGIFQIFYLVTIGLSCVVILTLIILFRAKKKANEVLSAKNIEIIQQKEEIEAQREEIEAQRDDLEIQRSIAVKQRDEITYQKKNITDSIAYAKHIQTAMLPNEAEILDVIPHNFIFFKPLDIVSGDFYWVNKIDGMSILAVADCTGHGVPGGFMSVMGINFLTTIIIEQGITEPGRVLNLMNQYVISALSHTDTHLQDKDGMDISLCRIDWSKMEMRYSCAHNRILICRGSELFQLETGKYSIGKSPFVEKIEFATSTFNVQKGDMVYLMTDGFVDQFGGPYRIKFLTSKFKKLVLEIAHLDPKNQQKILEKTIEEWQGKYPQIDDMLILGFRI